MGPISNVRNFKTLGHYCNNLNFLICYVSLTLTEPTLNSDSSELSHSVGKATLLIFLPTTLVAFLKPKRERGSEEESNC